MYFNGLYLISILQFFINVAELMRVFNLMDCNEISNILKIHQTIPHIPSFYEVEKHPSI